MAGKRKAKRGFVVLVLVRDIFCRSGNCPEVYETEAAAQKAIKRDGIGYMKYRVERDRGA